MERQINLFLHFVGLGMLITAILGGYILNGHYRRAKDFQSKAVILRSLKPIGLMSPIGSLLMLITGIGNMHALGYGFVDIPGWLAYKIVFFAVALIGGILFAVKSRKRGALVTQLADGSAPTNAEDLIRAHDRQISLFYVALPLLFVIILYLSVLGRLGAQ